MSYVWFLKFLFRAACHAYALQQMDKKRSKLFCAHLLLSQYRLIYVENGGTTRFYFVLWHCMRFSCEFVTELLISRIALVFFQFGDGTKATSILSTIG